ncbi:unnamed protein product [Allacma fusca]|nr:unnamed protein product [Allacma fusca]
MILVVLGAFKKKIPQYLDVWIAYSLLQCGSAIGFLVVGLYNSNFTWPWKQLGVLIIIYIITVLMVIARKAQIEADIKTLEELNLTGLENRNGEYPLRFDIVQQLSAWIFHANRNGCS